MADLNDWDDPGHETDAAGANDSLDQTHEHDQQRKRSGRPQNAVWQHFNKAPATKDNPHSGAKCLLCPWKRPHVRVAQAIRHLLQECPGATPEVKAIAQKAAMDKRTSDSVGSAAPAPGCSSREAQTSRELSHVRVACRGLLHREKSFAPPLRCTGCGERAF